MRALPWLGSAQGIADERDGHWRVRRSSTFSTWPGTRTLRHASMSRPSAPNRNVERITPMCALPYSFFSPITSNARHQRFVGVGDERKRQVVLAAELLVRVGRIARDADDRAVLLAELRIEIAEILRFERAAGRHVLRIEVDDEWLSDEVGELQRRSVLQRAFELWSLFAGFEHRQNFIGSMIASRLSPSQNSRKSSRSAAMCIVFGMPIVICAENMSAPVCIAR